MLLSKRGAVRRTEGYNQSKKSEVERQKLIQYKLLPFEGACPGGTEGSNPGAAKRSKPFITQKICTTKIPSPTFGETNLTIP